MSIPLLQTTAFIFATIRQTESFFHPLLPQNHQNILFVFVESESREVSCVQNTLSSTKKGSYSALLFLLITEIKKILFCHCVGVALVGNNCCIYPLGISYMPTMFLSHIDIPFPSPNSFQSLMQSTKLHIFLLLFFITHQVQLMMFICLQVYRHSLEHDKHT